jgi:DNA-directed RNA polymerase specialized sigma24 family protein
MSQRDAAAVMEVSEMAFESMLARARRQLRKLLSHGGADDGP